MTLIDLDSAKVSFSKETYFASQESEMTPPPSLVVYLPIGISYYSKKGFNFGIDLGPGRAYERFIPYGNLKFGYRF